MVESLWQVGYCWNVLIRMRLCVGDVVRVYVRMGIEILILRDSFYAANSGYELL